ncbi:MAG: GNAT family N-acetyltransferase [Acidobacteriota bacterium]
MTISGLAIRPTEARDFPTILRLNLEFEAYLSPMDGDRLALLDSLSAYHRVVEQNGEIRAFLLAFREGSGYDSPNYRWFESCLDSFLYIDRIVVDRACQGLGLGGMLYRDLFDFARQQGVGTVTCEYDIEPPNDGSRRFHDSFGFRELGRQVLDGGKQVSLQARQLS